MAAREPSMLAGSAGRGTPTPRSDPTAPAPSRPAGPSAPRHRGPMGSSLRSSGRPPTSTWSRWSSEPDASPCRPSTTSSRHSSEAPAASSRRAAVVWSQPRTSTVGSGSQRRPPPIRACTAIDDGAPVGPGITSEAPALRIVADAAVSTARSIASTSPPIGPAPLATRNSPSGVLRNVSGGDEISSVHRSRCPTRSTTTEALALTRRRGRGCRRAPAPPSPRLPWRPGPHATT